MILRQVLLYPWRRETSPESQGTHPAHCPFSSGFGGWIYLFLLSFCHVLFFLRLLLVPGKRLLHDRESLPHFSLEVSRELLVVTPGSHKHGEVTKRWQVLSQWYHQKQRNTTKDLDTRCPGPFHWGFGHTSESNQFPSPTLPSENSQILNSSFFSVTRQPVLCLTSDTRVGVVSPHRNTGLGGFLTEPSGLVFSIPILQ